MSTTTARPPTLAGRTAIVTGASSGIGRATAAVLVERGARIAGLARDHVRLDSLARELGRACVPVALDLSDVGAIDALPERLPDGFATPTSSSIALATISAGGDPSTRQRLKTGRTRSPSTSSG
jgi:NADP-dependent 3-hydroxy acid dehydrogenase YdfG